MVRSPARSVLIATVALVVVQDPSGARTHPARPCNLNAPRDTSALPPLPADSLGAVEDSTGAPAFTTPPRVVNRDVVARTIERAYLRKWRDPSRPYRVVLWVLVDRAGSVPEVAVRESSGEREVDEAAVGVACVMEFTPALKFDEPVAAWISMPVAFQTR